ncbi:MAG TPA: protein kinase [Ktedonobacteraceae bacterium]|nr:protein kinase [Ktedonobacteraceae bacterium]
MIGLAGRTLDHYTLGQRVGKGGMADVYLGYDPHFQRPVAVKIFKQDSDGMLRRFMREAQIMAALHHPHLVPIYDTGESELDGVTRYYIVMPFVNGGTLGKRIQHSILSPDEASRYLFDIASALDYLHQHGIIHRDIKSTNVLLSTDDLCYLSDLGVARIMDDTSSLTTTGNVLGTVDYIAPELFVSDGKADARSDIYSLGVLLYEMITGRRPFAAENQVALASMHVNQPPPLPRLLVPNIAPQIENVLLKALEKDPERRYPTASALADAFYHATREQYVITTDALGYRGDYYDMVMPGAAFAQDVTQCADVLDVQSDVWQEKGGTRSAISWLPTSGRARLFIALSLFLVLLVVVAIPGVLLLQTRSPNKQAYVKIDAPAHKFVVAPAKATVVSKKKPAPTPVVHITPTPVHTAIPAPTVAPRTAATVPPTPTPLPTTTATPLPNVNLVQNPGYETQISNQLALPWVGTAAVTGINLNAGQAHTGNNNAWINVGPNSLHADLGQHVNVTPNTAYVVSVYIRTSPNIDPSMAVFGVQGAGGNTLQQINYSASSTSYTQLTLTFDSGTENSVYIHIGLNGPANAWVQVDDWMMHT